MVKLNSVGNLMARQYNAEGKISKGVNAMRYTLYAVWAGCILAFAAGCEETASKKISPAEQIKKLEHENAQLRTQVEQSRAETVHLKEQLNLLSALPEQARLETLNSLQKVVITRYTNIYDKDKDGQKETLVVYIQPIDEEGDVIKAPGTVDVQLWDLNRKDDQALLGQWHIGPNELEKLWFATFITINYRLTFNITGKVNDTDEDLVVKVTFTDYLNGRVFTEQKIIKPR